MRLAVISHKPVWRTDLPGTPFWTDGGFPIQMKAISELFDSTTLVVPCAEGGDLHGLTPLEGKRLSVVPLRAIRGQGLRRKLRMPMWTVRNGLHILRAIRNADAVHAPIPGDVGTIGMLTALVLRKPLFVRHCGNWLVQRTTAERFWRSMMERFGGGMNVMLATGGADRAPSKRNRNIQWIFSTSLAEEQIVRSRPRELPNDGHLRMIIACRQEARKGTNIVIESMPQILRAFPNVSLDVVGDGSRLTELRDLVENLGITGRVRFHGKLSHPDVLAALRKAHLFCFPTDASEGFPKAVLEALAMGLPIITTRVSVLPILAGQGGGVLIDRPDPACLASAVIALFSDRDRYREMSKKAIETARQYSLEAWRCRIGEILRAAWGVDSLSKNHLPPTIGTT